MTASVPGAGVVRRVDPVRILGVSAHYHDSAAALVVDGQIVAAASEERFTRRKGEAALPWGAVEYVLGHAGVAPDELTAVVFYENPLVKFERLLASHTVGKPGSILSFSRSMRTWVPNKLWVENQLRARLGKNVQVLLSDHHLSHAASAFYPSGFEDAAILTVDGVGEWSTTTIGQGSLRGVELLEHIEFPNSLGLLYSAATLYCGFKINSGEYKLMGLAPFGTPRFADTLREHVVHLDEDGSFSMNPEYFSYFGGLRTYNRRFEQLFGARSRRPSDDLAQVYADVAASIQDVLEAALAGLARRAALRTGASKLVMAGGVALNVVAVSALERAGLFDEVWVQPAAGDAGGSLGAALWASHEVFGVPYSPSGSDTMAGALLGPEPGSRGEQQALINSYGLHCEDLADDELAARVGELVAGGKVVAVARGRMEFGPRALGARSILADARDPSMQSRLNVKTKFREGFRPFAPVVLAEAAEEYFDTEGRPSPFMVKVFPVRDDLRRDPGDSEGSPFERVQQVRSTVPAVTHVDHSARVQTVDEARNPFLHAVLRSFQELTGCAVMVNTSFNVRGEPIVCSAEDAIECFLATDIDALVLGNFVIERSKQGASALRPRRSSAVRED